MNAKSAVKTGITALGLRPVVVKVLRELHTYRQNRLTPEEIERIYAHIYHDSAGYGDDCDDDSRPFVSDRTTKAAHAEAILEIWPNLGKTLIGGCSRAAAVIAFRNVGVDAYGFDISPDIEAMVLPEARPYVRAGSITEIPFGPEDGFETLITTDVLEHVQLKNIDSMMREFRRIGVRRMVHMINHVQRTPDHATLKPPEWWQKRIAEYGFRLRDDLKTRVFGPRIYGLDGDHDHVYRFWELECP